MKCQGQGLIWLTRVEENRTKNNNIETVCIYQNSYSTDPT